MTGTRPYCVGLTGGIGSGKSTVADQFAKLGVGVIDTDVISRALSAPGGAAMDEIVNQFGDKFRAPDGGLDRHRMRREVFTDPMARRRLEAILHPLIHAEAANRLAKVDRPYAMLVVPLLVETGTYGDLVDRVLVVDCDEAGQMTRILRRDGMDRPQAAAIIATQASRGRRLAAADDVLDNNGDLANLADQVERLHASYLRRAEISIRPLP